MSARESCAICMLHSNQANDSLRHLLVCSAAVCTAGFNDIMATPRNGVSWTEADWNTTSTDPSMTHPGQPYYISKVRHPAGRA